MSYPRVSPFIRRFGMLDIGTRTRDVVLPNVTFTKRSPILNTEALGNLTFAYKVADKVMETYRDGNPAPTDKWTCAVAIRTPMRLVVLFTRVDARVLTASKARAESLLLVRAQLTRPKQVSI